MISDVKSNKDKIKILRIIARLNMGGPAIHVLLLTSGLNNKRFLSYLVTGTVADGERDITYIAKEMGIDPFVIPELSREIRLNNDFASFLKLYNLMRKLKPDIVHTHTAKAGTLGRIAAMINRVPIRIHTFHGHVFHSYFSALRTRAFIMIEKILARFTNKIIVISQNQLNEVRDRYRIAPDEKCSVIPLGLNLGPFLNSDEKNTNEKNRRDTLSVGIVGRLVKVKNHRMFLDVVKKIRSDAPDMKVKFLIIGDGPLRNELGSYARNSKIEDLVIFTGWSIKLEAIYKDLDLVCLTSLNEGTPISLIEAMASGKPVISTDVGGVRDVVAHNESGLLSPSGDVERFSANLLKLLRNKEMRGRMGMAGRAAVIKKFSKERLFTDMERLYEKELQKRGTR